MGAEELGMTPSEIYRNWFAEVWNQHRSDLMTKFIADDAKFHTVAMDGEPVYGPGGFAPLFDQLVAAFPDIRFTVQHVIESGDFASGHWVADMTHTGPGLGAAPTGAHIQITGMAIIRCADGKVVECWDQWDKLGLLTKIGAVAAVSQ
jgi:predicted ester cyclase